MVKRCHLIVNSTNRQKHASNFKSKGTFISSHYMCQLCLLGENYRHWRVNELLFPVSIYDNHVCCKTCLVALLICRYYAGKIALANQHGCKFTNAKSYELIKQKDMFCFNHGSDFYTSNNIMKNVNEWQILGTNSKCKSYHCHALASCASNMSCSFSWTVCLIESRCVINSEKNCTLNLGSPRPHLFKCNSFYWPPLIVGCQK